MAVSEELPSQGGCAGGGGGSGAATNGGCSAASSSPPSRRRLRFDAALAPDSVDKRVLAELVWKGIPEGLSRAEVWQLLLGYRPLTRGRREEALQRKREEYCELRRNLYDASPAVTRAGDGSPRMVGGERDEELQLLRQIRKDLPRTRLRSGALAPCASSERLVEDPRIQSLMERVLFVWAVRQPASGYVQGLNDVLLPLIFVFISDRAVGWPLDGLDAQDRLRGVEADCYWCLTKILSEIFDHYTHGQPGIQRMVQRLRDILNRVDQPLARHLEVQGIDILHTAFRWITCLMVRELPMGCCVRLWDTFIAESALAAGDRLRKSEDGSAGWEALLVYFCACFTAYFSARLQAMDFEAITLFLQRMPTDHFVEGDVEAPQHLKGQNDGQL